MDRSSERPTTEIQELNEQLNEENHESEAHDLSQEYGETTELAPPSETQEKILSIVNNLSAANMEATAKEFIESLEEIFYPWFANRFVCKSVRMEPNFHELYINFLEKCRSEHLIKEILEKTYENCKVLLKSELIKSSTDERKLLKNLGSWLGLLTIGKNQVLLARHIDPKALILEAYEKGSMIGVIPFTSKILDSCKSSVVYQPPNPWTMAILELLAEIHAMPNLKASLKFEIEVLFKNLDVDMKTVTPTSLLKDRVRIIEGNPDFSQQQIVKEDMSTRISTVDQVELPSEAAAGPSYQCGSSNILDQLPAPTSDTPEFHLLYLNTHLQRVLPMAMDKAIDGIVSTIVEKTVSIATQTTMELVFKEFFTEPNEHLIHNVSCMLVACLAGNLSYITCKDPLRSSVSTELRNIVQGLNVASDVLEHAMQLVIDDNLEIGCATIEKAATEKGLMMIKKELSQQLSIRRNHREASRPATFDPNAQGNIGPPQQNFLPFDSQNSNQQWNTCTATANVANELGVHVPSDSKCLTIKVIKPSFTTGSALDKILILLEKLRFFTANEAKEGDIQSVIDEVRAVISKCIRQDEAAMAMAQMVFEGLYTDAANATHVDAYLAVLAAICDVSKPVGKELTGWVLNSDDDRKFNKGIMVGLIHRDLLNLAEYSSHMAKLINAGKNGTVTGFSISLVKALETSDVRVLSELHKLLDALAKVTNRPIARNENDIAQDPPGFHGKVSMLFAEWCRIRYVNDAIRAHYIQQLHQNVLSISDDMQNWFFHNLLELVVSRCISSDGMSSSSSQFHQPSVFIVIDILTDLIYSILKLYPVDQKSNTISLLSKVLTMIVGFITKQANEMKASFNPKPYFRLFTNFFAFFHSLDSVSTEAKFQLLTESLHALQPAKVPEFSFAWVNLVGHKDFMPRLLNEDHKKGWPYFQLLVIDSLQSMEPYLRTGEITEPVRVLYNGTLKLLSVLSHSYPEFLCYYHLNFCKVIPPHCTQLQNLILSAVPRDIWIPRS